MKQYTRKEFIRILEKNGFYYNRHNGSHSIYVNSNGKHISIPYNLECVIALRLIKENNLNTNLKRKKEVKESGYYPPGAEYDDRAPWRQKELKKREIDVLVSVTLSKSVKIKIDDIDNCNLKEEVQNQIVLPQDAWEYIVPSSKEEVNAIFDLKDWNVDDFECIIDDM